MYYKRTYTQSTIIDSQANNLTQQDFDDKIDAIRSRASSTEKQKEIVHDAMKDLRKHLKTLEDTEWLFEKNDQ